jgi:hypothetical protein
MTPPIVLTIAGSGTLPSHATHHPFRLILADLSLSILQPYQQTLAPALGSKPTSRPSPPSPAMPSPPSLLSPPKTRQACKPSKASPLRWCPLRSTPSWVIWVRRLSRRACSMAPRRSRRFVQPWRCITVRRTKGGGKKRSSSLTLFVCRRADTPSFLLRLSRPFGRSFCLGQRS